MGVCVCVCVKDGSRLGVMVSLRKYLKRFNRQTCSVHLDTPALINVLRTEGYFVAPVERVQRITLRKGVKVGTKYDTLLYFFILEECKCFV